MNKGNLRVRFAPKQFKKRKDSYNASCLTDLIVWKVLGRSSGRRPASKERVNVGSVVLPPQPTRNGSIRVGQSQKHAEDHASSVTGQS